MTNEVVTTEIEVEAISTEVENKLHVSEGMEKQETEETSVTTENKEVTALFINR
jgi:hypothetical protein